MIEEELRDQVEDNLLREAQKRRFIYSDVEVLVTDNFIADTIMLGDNLICLRSTLPKDLVALRNLEVLDNDTYLRWFVSHHVYMINGFILSEDKRDNHPYVIFEMFLKDLHYEFVDLLFYRVVGLRNRVERASNLIEAFCYEKFSRSYWATLGKEGISWHNANLIVKIWRTYNKVQDENDADEVQWQHTRVISGSMSKNASKSIEKFLKESRNKQKERRRRVIEDAVNWVIYGNPEDRANLPKRKIKIGDKVYDMPTTRGAQTSEEMIEEMRKVMAGEKDYHDILVEQYQENIKRKRLQAIEERRKKVEEAIKKRENEEVTGGTILAGYTREQLGAHRGQKNTQQVSDHMETYLFDRYFVPEIQVGVLGKEGPEKATEDNTKQVEKKSLQEKISSRNPHFKNS